MAAHVGETRWNLVVECLPSGHDTPRGNGCCHHSPAPRVLALAAKLGGWKPDGRHAYVTAERLRFQLLAPEEARGLEFDAVVVMEPAAFRASSGTNGRLYTSLTRANLELVVVHDKPLPAALARVAKKLQGPRPASRHMGTWASGGATYAVSHALASNCSRLQFWRRFKGESV